VEAAMFVRFVVGADSENPFWLNGVITEARLLRDDGELFGHEVDWLEETFDWFNEHLPCPPFQENLRSGEWTREAVSWFRAEAGEPIRRMWDIVSILREHGVPVRFVTTERPGWIVYSDHYQIVAETLKRTHR
jgi:hypothetical protein